MTSQWKSLIAWKKQPAVRNAQQVLKRRMRKLDMANLVQYIRRNPLLDFSFVIVGRYWNHQISIYAAALSYYTLFSTIPLLLFLISVGSFFLDSEMVASFTLSELSAMMPFAAETLRRNIVGVLRYRGTLGTISALGTLWSASGLFSALEKAINVVWECPGNRKFWERRFLGILTLLLLTAWILFTLWARTLVTLLPHWLPFLESFSASGTLWLERSVSFMTVVLFCVLLYRFFPAVSTRWHTSLALGGIVGLLWQITREAFAWALATGVLNYPLVYGSLWVLVVPIIWAYWSYTLLLLGAEVHVYIEKKMWLLQLQKDEHNRGDT